MAPSRTTARSLLEDSSPTKWSIPSKADLGMVAKPGRKDPGGPQLPHKTFQVWRLQPFVGWQPGTGVQHIILPVAAACAHSAAQAAFAATCSSCKQGASWCPQH